MTLRLAASVGVAARGGGIKAASSYRAMSGLKDGEGGALSAKRQLWKCPRCGHRFVSKNMWHSCVRVALGTHFRGRPPDRRRTYDKWLEAARCCGPVTAYAQKSRITFLARVRFAGAVVHKSYLEGTLWLRRRADHPLLRRVENLGQLGQIHYFRLERPEDIDADLEQLMLEAYRAGKEPDAYNAKVTTLSLK